VLLLTGFCCCAIAELGHWKLGHTPINFTMGQFVMLCNFLLFAAVRNAPGLYESFGFTKDKPALVAFLLFNFLVSPVDEVRAVFHACACSSSASF
jgi:STE24 endopeptidase